ncbi:cellulase-like family protein [Paenibacillus spongiae]|uniref:Cellulase n=1 Tax=Paenibacillus spongiae TaxID=2909671 RepID=A0ABY5SL43_9BACL|nr:cellulase-like family protein [Paenibacillus spongiae]UVI33385.1 hypothetical protein L1F29_16755 [Paenibacillus spongiae]
MIKCSNQTETYAIAMWDFSWLTCRYRGGGFEHWERALDELAARGYNAVRIDAFPHLIASDHDGNRCDTFRMYPRNFGFSFWGNAFTVDIRPGEALVRFLKACESRNISVGLSTWLVESDPVRSGKLGGIDDFIRIWDETMLYLEEHDALGPVMYVDVLNEYPYFHGFHWLKLKMEELKEPKTAGRTANGAQQSFYREAIGEALMSLRTRWQDTDWFASQTQNVWTEDIDMDYSTFDLLDIHLWFVHNRELAKGDPFLAAQYEDREWGPIYSRTMELWREGKDKYVSWLEGKVAEMCGVADRWSLPIGNTEGWGAIFWDEHPSLDWNWIRETAEIGARTGRRFGYSFNCTSNFCHPYFTGYWEDADWHREMTGIIRSGSRRGSGLSTGN